MIQQFFSIFIDVVTPVFGLVLISYLAGPRLNLEAKTLSRTAYFLFIPAFVFDIISRAEVEAALALRMITCITVIHLALALLGFTLARLLKRPREVVGAYVLIAVFGNTGNFGLSLIDFRLGPEGMMTATIYFLGLTVITFAVGVGAASWARGSGTGALMSIFKTPALIAFVPAAVINLAGIPLPLFFTRMTGLLGQAMIPTMLVTLGLQLAATGRPRVTGDVFVASALRLIAGPVLATLLMLPFGLTGLERATGILQSSMPAAVLTAVIAIEHDLVPEMVTHTVLFSTLASFFTLTVLLSVV